jgi:Leu/Phe-tRNA-protein transferase
MVSNFEALNFRSNFLYNSNNLMAMQNTNMITTLIQGTYEQLFFMTNETDLSWWWHTRALQDRLPFQMSRWYKLHQHNKSHSVLFSVKHHLSQQPCRTFQEFISWIFQNLIWNYVIIILTQTETI